MTGAIDDRDNFIPEQKNDQNNKDHLSMGQNFEIFLHRDGENEPISHMSGTQEQESNRLSVSYVTTY